MVNTTRKLSTSKELNVGFSLPNATLFGGALPLLNYVKRLKVTKLFEEALTFFKGPNSRYDLPQICVTQIVGRLLGKDRISHFEEIEKDKFLARELNFTKGKLPDTTTLSKDLDRFDSTDKIEMLKAGRGVEYMKVHILSNIPNLNTKLMAGVSPVALSLSVQKKYLKKNN
jgi:hypothetical protein